VLYDTLVKKKGAVLLPTFSSGVLYDLLDYVDNFLKSQGLNVPVLLISPIAKACLDVSGISSEWLFDARQGKAFQATHPFGHHDMLKSQRLQVYASVHDQAFVEAFGAFVHVSSMKGHGLLPPPPRPHRRPPPSPPPWPRPRRPPRPMSALVATPVLTLTRALCFAGTLR
jgi:hypothetical protein